VQGQQACLEARVPLVLVDLPAVLERRERQDSRVILVLSAHLAPQVRLGQAGSQVRLGPVDYPDQAGEQELLGQLEQPVPLEHLGRPVCKVQVALQVSRERKEALELQVQLVQVDWLAHRDLLALQDQQVDLGALDNLVLLVLLVQAEHWGSLDPLAFPGQMARLVRQGPPVSLVHRELQEHPVRRDPTVRLELLVHLEL